VEHNFPLFKDGAVYSYFLLNNMVENRRGVGIETSQWRNEIKASAKSHR
jgi:hypothetical protein